nr:hypothetical protein CFP56_02008 [Quercus suber]
MTRYRDGHSAVRFTISFLFYYLLAGLLKFEVLCIKDFSLRKWNSLSSDLNIIKASRWGHGQELVIYLGFSWQDLFLTWNDLPGCPFPKS